MPVRVAAMWSRKAARSVILSLALRLAEEFHSFPAMSSFGSDVQVPQKVT
jgi:hypothetical protein